mmetsp:Transcript_3522/g.10381  ORF Transcript_3522/g.10381 Transcript_3522/m.10381 type:complete len:406 (-) Transcript_3522:188-1405(-)
MTERVCKESNAEGSELAGEGLPPSLKAYATRAFAVCNGDVERSQMQSRLHRIISGALANGRLQTIDWASASIPPINRGDWPVAKRRNAQNESMAPLPSACEVAAREARASRFRGCSIAVSTNIQNPLVQNIVAPVRGTCKVLEKDYFRLTSAPDPATVRPEPVLAAALSQLKAKWRAGAIDYAWACNQFKAIRQDLTVQGIRSVFAIHVYETHARVALESADVNEYNQCQTQLKELYATAGFGNVGHQMEFVAYRIFYNLYLSYSGSTDAGHAELLRILNEMPVAGWEAMPVIHALKIRKALAQGNYASFFRLHAKAPNMGAYILDLFTDSVRVDAATKILRAYRPTISLEAISTQLGFFDDAKDCRTFLGKLGFVFDANENCLCKESRCDPAGLTEDRTRSTLL